MKEIDFLSYPNVEFKVSASENFKRWRVSNIILKKNKSFILIDGDILLTFKGQFSFPKLFNEIEVKIKIETFRFAKLMELFPVVKHIPLRAYLGKEVGVDAIIEGVQI